MQHKTKKIWLIALLSLLIAALFAASFTYARYYKETGVTGGKYDDTIEFVGANKYIVYTPEELVAAIENGYSYIEIAEDVEDPFIITDGVTDVSANLVLDINGHNLVRNSRNPLIDVQENVSVVIVYDSKASGSFYNPVGSMLQASGGTLTIATGNFTSGPKAEDYVKDDRRTDKGVSYSLEKYTVYYRDGYTPGATSPNRSAEYIDTGVEADLPKIVPVAIDSEAEDRYGNIYFENGIGSNDYIKDDTFLIYTEETVETPEDATVNVDFSPLCDVASCDFYYYYEKSTEGSGEDKTTTYAVIYGYHDVMAGAKKQITKTGFNTSGSINNNSAEAVIWPYATVRMTQGEAFIRGGSYTNRFGTAYSYGIYARGGSLSVQGENTSFTSVADGVCIRCTTEGGSAPSLHIENGSFTSYNGDTVQVNGGTMTVESGTFTKDATAALSDSTNNGSAISISGGKLSINGSGAENGKSVSFNINGSHVNGVKMEKTENDQTDIIKNAAFSFNHGHGGNSVAAIQVIGGKLEVSSSTFNFNQDHSGQSSANNGIYVQGGSVTATGCTFSLSPNGSVTRSAAIASVGGSVTATGSEFSVKGNSNYGVYSSGGTITATDCTITMTGTGSGLNDNFGIYSTLQEGSKGGTATANGCTITIDGTYSAGVLSMGGTLNVGASDTKATSITVKFTGNSLSSAGVSSEGGEINLTGNTTITSDGLGITARGEINVDSGTTTVDTKRGTGIYVQNGTLTVADVATVEVDSKIDDDCSWVVPPEHEGEPLNTNKYNGVFINGGSLKAEGTLNVEFVGVANDAFGSGENVGFTVNTAYRDFKIKSYAVRVEAASDSKTQVTIASGSITNLVGGGVYVGGGTVTLGDSKNNSGPTVTTTGTDVEETARNPFNYGGNWQYRLPIKGGPAVKVAGGESTTIYGGSYSSDQGDGIVTTGGSCTIHGGTFYGNDSYGMQAGPGASYSFKVYGGTVTVNSGTFGSSNANGGGAFVAGSTQETAEAQINGGSFLSGGQAAFSVLDNAEVTFGENDAANVVVTGLKAGLVLEGYKGIGSPEITINGGTFKSTDTNLDESSAIWAGNPDFTLTIKGGTFTGTGKDGIFIARRTWENNNRGENTPFSGTLKITGGNFTGNTHGLNFDRAITTGGTVEISGDTTKITGTNGSGLHLAGALYATHAVVISGGTFSGNYGGYYGKDGGGGNNDNNTYSDHVNDGLLITGGTFTGRSYGFFFNDNPWSQWQEDTWWQPQTEAFNNVAIVGGTFSSFGANDGGITVGDVFTMHVSNDEGRRYFGVSGSYDGSVGGGSGDPVNTLTIEITFITREY